MTKILADLFAKLDKDEVGKTMYLLQGRVVPLFEKLEFGTADKMVIRAVINALNLEKEKFEKEVREIGDLGKATYKAKSEVVSLEEKDLSITDVFNELYKLATTNGPGSQEVKIGILSTLIRQLDPLSSQFLVRIPLGVLRLGFSDMTILDAYSWMLAGDKSLRPQIEKAYHVRPDLGYLGEQLKKVGVKGIESVQPQAFTPIIMMRAERLPSPEEIIERIGTAMVEPKYDGFRLQVHYKKSTGEVRLYSRNLEEVSYMYPDLIEGVQKEVKADDIIFEGEAIGFDVNTGNFLPFQETSQRKRKHGIEEKAKEIPLRLFSFEILYVNGKNLLTTPFIERRKELEKAVQLTGDVYKDIILIAPNHETSDAKELDLMFEDAISRGLEGIVAKKLDGIYQPGARGLNWIKFKRSYSAKIEDTIDCLVMGYDYGKGKRTDFGIGAFLVGVYDEKENSFVTVAKIGTGLSDDEWRELAKRSEKFASDEKPALYDVDKAMSVDRWIKPEIIVEIKADEITRSTVHTAGRIMKASKSGSAFDVDIPGYALRFPRLQKFRTDKRPEDITSLGEMETLFKHQGKQE